MPSFGRARGTPVPKTGFCTPLPPGLQSVLPQKDIPIGETLEGRGRPTEAHGQDIGGLPGQPLGEIHGLVDPRIEDDRDAGLLRAGDFQRVAVALGDVARIPAVEGPLAVADPGPMEISPRLKDGPCLEILLKQRGRRMNFLESLAVWEKV